MYTKIAVTSEMPHRIMKPYFSLGLVLKVINKIRNSYFNYKKNRLSSIQRTIFMIL